MSQPITLEALHRDEALRQREFPVVKGRVFWQHAGVTALPRCVVEAMRRYLDDCTRADQESALEERHVLHTRQLAAQLIGCTPQEIALLGPTSLGLSLVANGLDWQRGDNVVFYPEDYPANVYPWLGLGSKGVEARRVTCARTGHFGWKEVEPLLDKRTRLVALATVNFLSGHRIDVDDIGQRLRERGVLFCADAIQSFGALPTKVTHVDFAAADSHKWLLGPLSAGIVYVRREAQDRLRPALLGAMNVSAPHFIAQPEIQLPPHAGRYEPGALNLAGIVGLNASLKLILRVGIEQIEARIQAFGERIIGAMERRGFEYIGSRERNERSGILCFRKGDADIVAIHTRLRERGIFTSLRMLRDGTKLLRFSPHFYNTDAELEQVLAAL